MSCPFRRLRDLTTKANPVGRGGFSGRIGRVIGQRHFAEGVLALQLLVTCAGWYVFESQMASWLPHIIIVPAGVVINLLLYYIIHSLTRREKAIAAKAAAMSEEIRRSAERYRAVVDTAVDAIVLADQRGTITSFNRAAEKIFGYAAHEVLGRSVHVLMDGDQATAHDRQMSRFVETGAAHVVGISREVEGRRKDGTAFPLLLSLASWRSGPDEIGFTAIMRDITEQKNAQRALEKSEHQLQTIMDCATDFAIFQVDLSRRIVKWNKGTEHILGYSAAELDGLSADRLFLEEDLKDGIPKKIAESAIRRGHQETECWHLRKDGRIFWGSGVVQPIFDGAEVTGMAVVLRDTTSQRAGTELIQLAKEQAEIAVWRESELRARIEASNQELKTANEGLQKFASIVAHDLRAPLKRIDGFINALREDCGDRIGAEGHEMLTRINHGAVRMKLMLDSMLDYSRYNARALSGKTADLASVVSGVIDNCDFQGFEPCIKVNVGAIPQLPGDPLLLAHVFQNLIGNAIKFRRDDDLRIDIDVIPGPDEICVSVADNGIGIEPQFADRVFDMFCRLHNDDEYEGIGIGLTVCRKIVNDHGGRIWVDKTYQRGARIVMTLPCANDNVEAQRSVDAA